MASGSPRASNRRRSVRSVSATELSSLLGPAEAQYAELLDLAIEGPAGVIACGSTVVDQGPDDDNPDPDNARVRLTWNDLTGETGYVVQRSNGATYVSCTGGCFSKDADTTTDTVGSPTDRTQTLRVMAHFGHTHADHPGFDFDVVLPGDAFSNTCTVTFELRADP